MSASEEPITQPIHPFQFESYGVFIEINSNEQWIIDSAAEVAKVSLLGNVRKVRRKRFDYRFDLTLTQGGRYLMIQNGQRISSGRSKMKFFKFFDAMIRVSIGESAPDLVFLHAGVVAWKGKAIVMPADSFQGKTTLVAELVRRGAEYYSDEFALIDEDALVHPFARDLSMRSTVNGAVREDPIKVEDLGGKAGTVALPVSLVLLTSYVQGARWRPQVLSPGSGVLSMIPFTLSMPIRPETSMRVLNNVAQNAIIISSRRSSAENFVKILLDFVDKSVN